MLSSRVPDHDPGSSGPRPWSTQVLGNGGVPGCDTLNFPPKEPAGGGAEPGHAWRKCLKALRERPVSYRASLK